MRRKHDPKINTWGATVSTPPKSEEWPFRVICWYLLCRKLLIRSRKFFDRPTLSNLNINASSIPYQLLWYIWKYCCSFLSRKTVKTTYTSLVINKNLFIQEFDGLKPDWAPSYKKIWATIFNSSLIQECVEMITVIFNNNSSDSKYTKFIFTPCILIKRSTKIYWISVKSHIVSWMEECLFFSISAY